MADSLFASSLSLRQDCYQSHVGFLLAELSLALTFVEVARTATHAEDRVRNYTNAKVAYETVGRFYCRLGVYTPADQVAIDEKREHLRQQLSALGAAA